MEQLHLQRTMYPNPCTRDFIRTLAILTPEESELLLKDHCTMQELRQISERWSIAKLIWMGFPYRVITQKTGASSTTIARVAHWIHYGEGGYARAFQLREQDIKLEKEALYRTKVLGVETSEETDRIKTVTYGAHSSDG